MVGRSTRSLDVIKMSSARDWTIPTAVGGVVALVGALIVGGFLGDFLFTDVCLDRGGMIEGSQCIGANVEPMGAVPYVLATGFALLVTLGIGHVFRRMSHRGAR